jgi:coproporphyrinogen III oxidase-like Fe-S oxidoreductase
MTTTSVATPPPHFKERQTECWTYPRICKYDNAIAATDSYFAFLDAAPEPNVPMRIYVHIPFCKQFCTFCPYHKSVYGATSRDEQNRLFAAFVREMEMYGRRRQVADRKVATIYFGGGDPGVISIEQRAMLWKGLRDNFDWQDTVDISMEGTALSFLDDEKLAQMKSLGVSRVSFGIQTFEESLRPQLNLEPTIPQIYSAIEKLKKAGLDNYSVDMMYNLPGQTDEMFYRDLERVRGIGARYIDFYALNLYPNTTYMKQVSESRWGEKPTNPREIWMYREIMRVTREWGYNQVSSVSVSAEATESHIGFEQFLQGYPMIGIGPSSRSFLAGRNFRNHSTDDAYMNDVYADRLPVEAAAPFSAEDEENRPFVFFPIRTRIAWKEVEKSPRNRAIVEDLIRGGYASRRRELVELTEEGRVWAGNIQRAFFTPKERARERQSFFRALADKTNPYNQDLMGISRVSRRRRPASPTA